MVTKNETSKIKQKAYSSGLSARTLRTEILAQDLAICEEWNISIDLKLPNRSMTKWTKIFSTQVIETTDLKVDSNIPAVWIRQDQSSVMLMIDYKIDKNPTNQYNITKKVNEGNWINLKISQVSGVYQIVVDYEIVYTKTKLVPKTWTTVNLSTGDMNGNESISTIVNYRNFEINTCKTRGKKDMQEC